MHLRTAVVLLTTVFGVLAAAELDAPVAELDEVAPPVKLDKNLRQALLKALSDLEAESAEQHRKNNNSDDYTEEPITTPSGVTTLPDVAKKDLDTHFGTAQKTTFSFDGFPGDEEIPNEEKLQNSSFVEVDKYVIETSPNDVSRPLSKTHEELRSSQVHDVISSDKSAAIYVKSPGPVDDNLGNDHQETRSVKTSGSSVNSVQSVTLKPLFQFTESLVRSASSSIAAAGNSLQPPKPTVSSPTAETKAKVSSSSSSSSSSVGKAEDSQEVKIFQAPLVAAFTVQQDERGVPKSVVPIYRATGDGQALTLQEQLEFKQKQLDLQLVDLQQQQFQQTQFLAKQQQIYEEQLRYKQQQQQQLYLQEQARFKQLEEQRIYQHKLQQQQQQQQRSRQQATFDQNTLLNLQPPFESPNVQLEPSVSLQLPNVATPLVFQSNYQDRIRFQQLQQQQQLQLQQQQQLTQQRLQHNFANSFPTDFQPPVAQASRFNRQEAFGSTGNFGYNDNNNNFARNNYRVNYNTQTGTNQNFDFGGYNQFRQSKPQTPARQIQHLLYQSGVASDLGSLRGSGGPEDLNIVSKVLALNVGAFPTNSLQFGASQRVNSFAKPPNKA